MPLPVAVHATCCAEFVVVPLIVFLPVWSNTAGPFRVAVYVIPERKPPFPFWMPTSMVPLRWPIVYWYLMSRFEGVLATASFHNSFIFFVYVSQLVPSFQPRRSMPFRYSSPIGSSFWWMRPAIAACVRSSVFPLYLSASHASRCASGFVFASVHSPHVPAVPV